MLFRITHNDISPAFHRLLKLARNPQPVLRAAGNVFMSITMGTFNSVGASFRPITWEPKADGAPCNLQQSTTLARAFHLEVTNTTATVSNPMPYAAIHQHGGRIEAKNAKALRWIGDDGQPHFAKAVTMPARPFFPVVNDRLTEPAQRLVLAAGEKAVRRQYEG
jgi:phage gpG-like protein